MKIKKLSKNLINILAAWEVVERPYSVVKELVENSIDAWADEIIVEIEKWWKKIIKVSDNWNWIDKEDLPLTVEEFATSKISKVEDLMSLNSFWFRWEALSTISEVSKFKIITKTEKDWWIWWKLEKIWWKVKIEPISVNFEHWTEIFVEDIFFNLPVRQKFLKSEQTEFKYIQELMQNYSIKYFDKSFKLIHNKKVVFDYKADLDLMSRLKQIFPSSWSENYLYYEYSDWWIQLYGVLWKSNLKFNSNMIKIFVNWRPVKDRIIQKAIMQAYSRWLEPWMYPFVILFLDLDSKLVDVNVHPRKEEVKFIDPWSIYNLVFSKIKQKIESDKWYENKVAKVSDFKFSMNSVKNNNFKTDINSTLFNVQSNVIINQSVFENNIDNWDKRIIGQIFDSYILFEKNNELYIVDQHAVAERIIFEKMRKEYNPEKVSLLSVPQTFEISNIENEKLVKLQKLWFDISKFWEKKVIVYAVPSVLEKYKIDINLLINSLLHSKVEDLGIEKMLEQVLATKSCKAAIKANHKLSLEEMKQLILDWEKYIDWFFVCQHWRPSIVRISKQDIDNFFDRK